MSRYHLPDVIAAFVLGSIAGTAIGLFVPVIPVAAETRAERTCLNFGVLPNSTAYEQCVARTTRAYEWGELEIAYTLARITRDARDTCLSYGGQPQSPYYQACLDREIDARSELVFTDDQTDRTMPPSQWIASQ